MRKYFLLPILLMLIATPVCAAPEKPSVTMLTDGGSATVTSTGGFGSDVDVSKIHWLKTNIEAGVDEAVFGGNDNQGHNWHTESSQTSSTQQAVYDTAEKHSKTKSIRHSYHSTQYVSQLTFDNGGQFTEFYLAYWRKWGGVRIVRPATIWRKGFNAASMMAPVHR